MGAVHSLEERPYTSEAGYLKSGLCSSLSQCLKIISKYNKA